MTEDKHSQQALSLRQTYLDALTVPSAPPAPSPIALVAWKAVMTKARELVLADLEEQNKRTTLSDSALIVSSAANAKGKKK